MTAEVHLIGPQATACYGGSDPSGEATELEHASEQYHLVRLPTSTPPKAGSPLEGPRRAGRVQTDRTYKRLWSAHISGMLVASWLTACSHLFERQGSLRTWSLDSSEEELRFVQGSERGHLILLSPRTPPKAGLQSEGPRRAGRVQTARTNKD